MPTHSTHAGVVRDYFESVRWLNRQAQSSEDTLQVRRVTAITTIQAVTAVEVFVNLWFRTFVAERGDKKLEQVLLSDLEGRAPLEKKLATWPKRHLGSKLELHRGPGLAFIELKNLRNSIVHFASNYATVHVPQLIIHGLADTSKYDALLGVDAEKALVAAENLVAEIFRLAGFDEVTRERALAVWIARIGRNPSVESTNVAVPPWLAPHVER